MKPLMIKKITAVLLLIMTVGPAAAQHTHSQNKMPNETGQSAFAALAEIVEQLRKDENTDWSKVNIDALRAHLADMDNVTLRSKAVTREHEGKIVFTITGQGTVIASIQRMANAHAPMLANETGWGVSVKNTADGAVMEIAANDNQRAMIKGLGFYGVMTIGAHHQMHHMMIASGHDPH